VLMWLLRLFRRDSSPEFGMRVAGLEPHLGNTIVMCAFLWILSPYAHVAGFLLYGKVLVIKG
jgi:hypothetical protein